MTSEPNCRLFCAQRRKRLSVTACSACETTGYEPKLAQLKAMSLWTSSMARPENGLQPGLREGEDSGQRERNDHGQGQVPNAFWSDGVQDEFRLANARPAGLPSETPSENLLELDLDEDELRTAGESTPPSSWEPLANHGTTWQEVDQMQGDVMVTRDYLTDSKDVPVKDGVMNKFMALRRILLVDSKTAMDEFGVWDKSEALMVSYLQQKFEGQTVQRDGTWMRSLDHHHHLYLEFMEDLIMMSKDDRGNRKHFAKVGVLSNGNSWNVDHVRYILDKVKVLDFHETVINKILYVLVLKEAII
eukprot:s1816_g16.t1